ncbi:isocitrate/isopropylmalate dehydrogenase family protein [Actinobacteria bacterium YIM 96077]|uniref:NAD-dependent isocitrate dehydrogenase n=2 Tax=Phytoactinopolyspora halophila TaxID=1981511 RepID=A0A329QN73_9ACTN|nr:isocitrate/isopropylmalate dehydrogenase family protein [Actinobacteria bacterium YIM 96077]RAW13815.1 NAD-dependent isocitrate dehydrogenase [Phytoactinopolyspora halophila]
MPSGMPNGSPGQGRPVEICVIPGDGVGVEVIAAACRVLDAVTRAGGPRWVRTEHAAGYAAYRETGEPLPRATVEAAQQADGVLVGAMDAARIPGGLPQPIRALRRELETVASLRRCRTLPGVPAPSGPLDVMVVRELTEGFYAGVEYPVGNDGACAVRVVTREASARAARIALQCARERSCKVTAVHKRGAMPLTDSLFLTAVSEQASSFPDVEYETKNVDACAMEMVRAPQAFDTILCTNAFGDILSDLAAGLAGGLGLAASGCVGDRWAYFEPLHGTAPDIAGQGVANPLAAILSAALMLAHLGHHSWSTVVEESVADVLGAGGPLTADLGGDATTSDVAGAVCRRVVARAAGLAAAGRADADRAKAGDDADRGD